LEKIISHAHPEEQKKCFQESLKALTGSVFVLLAAIPARLHD